MSTIQFAGDAIHPVRSNGAAGGVYSTRNNASRTSNLVPDSKYSAKQADIEEADGSEAGLRQEGDVKKKQVGELHMTADSRQPLTVILGV